MEKEVDTLVKTVNITEKQTIEKAETSLTAEVYNAKYVTSRTEEW